MAIRIVQSKQNPRVKELRAALLRPSRRDDELVALEGIHLVEEALRSGTELAAVFVTGPDPTGAATATGLAVVNVRRAGSNSGQTRVR